MATYERPLVGRVLSALQRFDELIHVVTGPRQVGKTTLAQSIARCWSGPTHYAAADELFPPSTEWIRNQWQTARRLTRGAPSLLILDEVQKVPAWSEAVKALWDADRREGQRLCVLILGSSALLLAKGTSESLAGRFLLHRCAHWSWVECHDAFGWDLDRWLFFGGYPGAAALAGEVETWRSYVRDSLIESVLGGTCSPCSGSPSRLSCATCSPSLAVSRRRRFRTPRCSGSCRTLGTPPRWRITCGSWRPHSCSAAWSASLPGRRAAAARRPSWSCGTTDSSAP